MTDSSRDLTKTRDDIRKAAIKVTHKRYCSSCHAYKPENQGSMIATSNKNVKRWICTTCKERKSSRKYESKKVK